jgi:DNA-binding SARP family transcriptional activator
MLSIRLFGTPQITCEAQPLKLARRKSRAILYYVAAHPQPIPRDHLLAFFWPDAERAAGQQVLRTTLYGLRSALGPALLVADDAVGLAADVEIDVRCFEAALSVPTLSAVATPDLAAALELYRGALLADITMPDSPEFEDWMIAARERYHRLAVRGLIGLSNRHASQRDYTAALAALDRALALDPLQEDLQREAMRLHYLAGDRPGAIRRFMRLRELLDDEMGVPPMPETQAVYDAIVTDTLPIVTAPTAPPPAVPLTAAARPVDVMSAIASDAPPAGTLIVAPRPDGASPALPFAGRASEMATLARAVAGHKLALIEGEAGIGKTRLAEEFMASAGAVGLCGAARELEQTLPYQPVVEALRGLLTRPDWPALYAGARAALLPVWLDEVARLLPELAASRAPAPTAGRAADESRLWEGVNQFLLAVSRQLMASRQPDAGRGSRPDHAPPLLLLLDDLHWADASTLALLGYLVRQPPTAAVGYLATTRPQGPRSPLATLLQALTRDAAVQRITLGPLAEDDVTTIARRLSPTFTYPLADWLRRSAEGNPYILNEVVRHARGSTLLHADGTLDLNRLSASPVLPQTVYTLIQSRLARLSGPAGRVLEAAAVAGREFEFDVVTHAAGLSENAALDALDELLAAHLIRPADGLFYTFDHSLTVEVVIREMGEPRVRLLHRRVAEALEVVYRGRTDAVVGVLASHFVAGGALDRAAPYAHQAGKRAALLAAWREAIAFYEQALAGTPDERRGDILMSLGDAYSRLGETADASEAYRSALTLAQARQDAAGADTARLALAQSMFTQSRFAAAIALAQEVIAAGRGESVMEAEFTWGTALSIEGADLAGAAEHLRRAIALAPVGQPPARLAQAYFELGSVAAQQGNLHEAIAFYREALAVAGEADEALVHRILAYNNLAYHLHLLNDPSAAEYATAGMALAQERGVLGVQTYLYSTLGEIALARGDLDAAERNFTDGLALAERITMPERIAGLTANLGLVAAARGEQARAVNRLSTALARADAAGTQHLAAQIRIWLVPLLPPADARRYLAEARAIAESGGRRLLLEQVARLEAALPN